MSAPPHMIESPVYGSELPSNTKNHEETRPPSYRSSVHGTSSLNILSRTERKLAQYNASQNIFKRWLFEILSIATSAICIGAIIAILAMMKDEPLRKWPQGLTIVAILSKVASAALILPISEAIGQLKWSWFNGKRSKDAFDFEIFDKASRGAWGSVLLLLRTRGRSLAALGALLTVLLLAIDTFFQQVTDLPEKWTLRDQGFIPRVKRYEPGVVSTYDSTYVRDPMPPVNQDVKGALTPYFYDKNGTQHTTNGNGLQADFPLFCPTSRCEWSSYQTLAICSSCKDVSSLLTYACLPMRMDWILNATGPGSEDTWTNGTACGYFLNATSATPMLMSGYRVPDDASNTTFGETLLMRTLPLVKNPSREPLFGGSINFKDTNHRILDALIVSSADGSTQAVYQKEIPIAHECMLSWCVQELRSSFSSGVYEEATESIFFNTTQTPWPWKTTYYPEFEITDTEYHNNITLYPPGAAHDGLGWGLSNETIFDFVLQLDDIFPSTITVADAQSKPYLKIRTTFTDKVMYRDVRFSPWLAPNNVTHHMQRIARALTNVIRSDSNSNEYIAGKAFAVETYVQVQWPWLAFPLAMLCLCLAFLVATMVKTSKEGNDGYGAWKTSAMPTLMYGLPQETRKDLTAGSTWRSENCGGAKRVKIRLTPTQGWRVSGHDYKSPTIYNRSGSRAPPGWI